MKEKAIVLLAIALAIFAMLVSACTGVAAATVYPPVDEPGYTLSAGAADVGRPLAVYIDPIDAT